MSGSARSNMIVLVAVLAVSVLLMGRIAAKKQPTADASASAPVKAAAHKSPVKDNYVSGKELLDIRGTGTAYDIPVNVVNSKEIEVYKPEDKSEADRRIARALDKDEPVMICFYDSGKPSQKVMGLVGEVSDSLPGMFEVVKVDLNAPEGKDIAGRIGKVEAAPTVVAMTQKGQIKTRLVGQVEKKHIVEAYSKIVGCSDICEPGEC
ncbi:MAG: hypothetical protein IT210_01655 [Armatimonadetes bacterium]|nr:hypothetical protein [Armatimonadota bacterium]